MGGWPLPMQLKKPSQDRPLRQWRSRHESASGGLMTEPIDRIPPTNGRVHGDAPPDLAHLLAQPLDPSLVSLRAGHDGRMVAYLEGHQAINQANRIFGYGRWGSEIVGAIGYRD